ncbi:MAG: glycosyltransferase family 2 protein [Solirubrobacterales bacterium]
MPPRVALLVVNYFSSESVRSLITSLEGRTDHVELHVVIVDNSCDAEEWSRLSAVAESCALSSDVLGLVRSESNLGYAGGNNLAYRSCRDWKPDSVFVINPDVTLADGTLLDAAEQIAANGKTLFGARTRKPRGDAGLWTMRRWDGRTREMAASESARDQPPITYPSGHLIAASAQTWEMLAGFSEDFFLFSEEVDLVLRARQFGAEVGLLTAFDVHHEVGLTTGSSTTLERRSITTYFHASRSRIILYRKHRSLKPFLVSALIARTAWSLLVQIRVGRDAGTAVRRGIRAGLRERLTAGGSSR